MNDQAATVASPYKTREPYIFVLVLTAILAAIAWIGIRSDQESGLRWAQILLLMIAFATIAGRAITGKWRGILIDHLFRMNLSRLQLLVWTVLVLSALFTAVLVNVAAGSDTPLSIDIPSELWVLLGISTASAVASPILDAKPSVASKGDFDDARWGDLLKGDEVGKTKTVDVGKLQMFFMTFILVVSYGAAIAAKLSGDATEIAELPPVDDGMNVLLGISQVGYLATKAGRGAG